MKFATYDKSENVIWGTGETAEAAQADARHWLGLNHEDGPEVVDTLNTDACTDALAVVAMRSGGQVDWQWSGTLPRYMQLVVMPNPHNVSWDHCGFITVDDMIVGKVDDDCKLYVDCVEQVEAACDIDDLKLTVAELISDSDPEVHYINQNVAAWAASR